MKIGITGAPSSATQWMWLALHERGVPITHNDEVGEAGMCCWNLPIVVDTRQFDVVLHQVRNPLRVLAGIHIFAVRPAFRKEVSPYVQVRARTTVEWCAEFWMLWNSWLETFAARRYRVEDIDSEFHWIADLFGCSHDVPALPRNYNSKRKAKHYRRVSAAHVREAMRPERYLQWTDQCKRYGYSIKGA